jgi:hypothetical protein
LVVEDLLYTEPTAVNTDVIIADGIFATAKASPSTSCLYFVGIPFSKVNSALLLAKNDLDIGRNDVVEYDGENTIDEKFRSPIVLPLFIVTL